ncbi:hypothetical protein [Thiothrix fructosivorans]|uniref:Uncharacterized protein n=1 Tax=Thiothrix fructosivorans TaxID=111770 RepID=A0A8B0SMF4_9GAMM|nr:hypothetical protein [Thiothrix fructosivorans]MBO0613689.1 hypothetical protein [Thiothrix fructosivorans]QTX10897.1 hypothetical protein J1836_000515 [Thiothrix fructosivorans]
MPVLSIELTETEYSLLLNKANSCDLQQVTRVALDQYFHSHRFTDENLPILDLSGHRKAAAALQGSRVDPRLPVAPNRYETGNDGRCIYEDDAAFDRAVSAHQWILKRHSAEKATFARKRSEGVVNAFGGITCTL